METTNILCLLIGATAGVVGTLTAICVLIFWTAGGSPDVNGAPEKDAGLPLQPATSR